MPKKYDIAVVIGRFQPVHNAHIELINAAKQYSNNVVVLIGSANKSISIKNPFTFLQRKLQLKYCCNNITTFPLDDSLYNEDKWLYNIHKIIHDYAFHKLGITEDLEICLIGHKKDDSSYYLNLFPKWTFIDIGTVDTLHSTDIRDLYFKDSCNMNYFKGVVPKEIFHELEVFRNTESYLKLVKEREFIDKYKSQYINYPYEPIFVTCDAVVIQSGYVLMVKRGAEPGKGQLAFPGGFVNAKTDKSIKDAMIRELYEETKIKLPRKIIEGSITKTQVFDHPDRSLRGRTITHAFKISLNDGEWNLPKIKGGDDAESAQWIPISSIDPIKCYEDHYEILMTMLEM